MGPELTQDEIAAAVTAILYMRAEGEPIGDLLCGRCEKRVQHMFDRAVISIVPVGMASNVAVYCSVCGRASWIRSGDPRLVQAMGL